VSTTFVARFRMGPATGFARMDVAKPVVFVAFRITVADER
jgi:hypothetical protein